jgi:hypothetical protein
MKRLVACLALLTFMLGAQTMEYRQWRPAEFSFQAEDAYEHVPLGVRFGARFTGPDGSVYEVPGFWDGGQTWRLRFAPTMPGAWSYETTCTETESRVFRELYTGKTMHGNEPAQLVDVEIGKAEELILLVKDGGDGSNYDHADWADAHIVKRDGSVVYLDTLTPSSTHQGHGKLSLRTNIPGQPLRIAGRTFEHGLGTHAPGRTIYQLDGSEVRFRAWVGVDATVKEHGSVSFAVATSLRDTSRSGRRDPGLHGRKGTFAALPATGDNPLFRHGGFLRVSQDGHSLAYSDGTPFFWLGDTWWFCPSDLVPIDGSTNPEIPSAYHDLIQVRKRQGFTAIHMAFLGTIDGISPYQDAMRGPDLTPAYWQKVDRYMDYANANGLIPVIGLGWAGNPLSPEDWRIVWRHLIARYGAHAATWLICGEYNVRNTSDEQIANTLALGQFIKDTDPYHRAMTVHPWYYAGDRRQAWNQPWYDFIMFQGGHGEPPPTKLYREACSHTPVRPVLEGECQYEGIGVFTDSHVRNVAYRAIQNGSCGYTYGSQGLWYPTQNEKDTRTDNWGKPLVWWQAVRRPGAEQLGYLRRIYETVDWWRLKPSPEMLVTASATDAPGVTVLHDLVKHFAEAKATNAHWSRLSEDEPDCVSLHPESKGDTELTYPPIMLPEVRADERLLLITAIGISRKANLADPKHPSDGVQFAVKVDGEDAFRQHRNTKPWLYQAVDLTAKAGQETTIALATAAGENMFWDHAMFRHPTVIRVGKGQPTPCREAYVSPPPRTAFVKADGDRTLVLYYPASEGAGRHRLRALPANVQYTATWHNPRTGEALPARALASQPGALRLPSPPDAHDWILVLQKV